MHGAGMLMGIGGVEMGPDPDDLGPAPGKSSAGEVAGGAELPGAGAAAVEAFTRRRWLIWSVLALSFFIVLFHRIAPGVVADRLMADFAVGGAAVGVLTSIYFYMYAVMQVPAGVLADTLGARKTVAIGTMVAGVGSLVFGLAPTLEVAYAGRFLVGLGVSVIFVATLKFQVNWFRAAEFGTVSGLLMVVGNLGSVMATSPVALLAQTLGWRLTFMLIGGATCLVAVAVWQLVRDTPAELGLSSRTGAFAPSGSSRTSSSGQARRRPFLVEARSVLANSQTRAGFLGLFGTMGSYLTFVGLWAVPYLMHSYGMDRFEASNYLLAATLAVLISAPLFGYVSDRVLRQRRLPILMLGALTCTAWLAFSLWDGGRPPAWTLYPLFLILGFSGGIVTLILTAVKEASPPAVAGLAMGTANVGAFLCAAALQPAVGYLLDSYWLGAMEAGARVYPVAGYQVAFWIIAGFGIAGWIGAWMLKETHCRNVAEG
jgi:sugar phosphate permease